MSLHVDGFWHFVTPSFLVFSLFLFVMSDYILYFCGKKKKNG